MKIINILLILALLLIVNGVSAAIDSRSLYEQGIESFKSGNYGSAILLLRKIVDEDDEEYRDRAWFYIARSIFEQKKNKSAIYEFNRFLNKCRTVDLAIKARFWLGEAHYRLEDYVEAIEEYKRFISKSGEKEMKALAHDRIASIYFKQLRYDEAVIEWETALEIDSDKEKNGLRIVKIGEALFYSEEYEEAIARLNPVLTSRIDPKILARARLILGRIYQIQGNHRKAILTFNGIPQYLLKSPPFNEAQYFKAVSYRELGDLATAKSYFEFFIMIGQNSKWYYNALFEYSMILVKRNQVSTGMEKLKEVVEGSGDAELKTSATVVLSRLLIDKDPDKAIEYLESSLSFSGQTEKKDIYLLLGKSLLAVEKPDSAVEFLELFIDKFPYDSRIDESKYLLATAYLELGETGKSLRIFKEIRKEHPFSEFNEETDYQMARIYLEKGDHGEALSLLKRYSNENGNVSSFKVISLYAEIYMDRGYLDQAKRFIDQIVKRYRTEQDVDAIIYRYSRMLADAGRDNSFYTGFLMSYYPDSRVTTRVYLQYADELYNKKNYIRAMVFYRKYLSGPNGEKQEYAFFQLLKCHYTHQQYQEVVNIVEKELPSGIKLEEAREIQVIVGKSHYRLEQYDKAYAVLKSSSIENFSNDDMLLYIKTALAVGDIVDAVDTLKNMDNNSDEYIEASYLIGEYYNDKGMNEKSTKYYNSIVSENKDSEFTARAQSRLAEIYIKIGRFNDALSIADSISSDGGENIKKALKILIFFNQEKNDAAASLVETCSFSGSSELNEQILRETVEYYYEKRDTRKMLIYGRKLRRYREQIPYIEYLTGNLYYQDKYFQKSYYNFYRLSQMDSKYQDEAFFMLGKISLFVHLNKLRAIQYFARLVRDESVNKRLRMQSKIYLAIILHDLYRKKDSKKILKEVLNSDVRGTLRSQASNLYEHYGY